MKSRYNKIKDIFKGYRIRTKEKRTDFIKYIREERKNIILRERKKIRQRILFWSIFLGSSYILYSELYCKIIENRKMKNKLNTFYDSILTKQQIYDQAELYHLHPKSIEQLSNLISLSYRYHYKIVVNSSYISEKERKKIWDNTEGKCIFVNLEFLNTININQNNDSIKVQSGAKCCEVNKILEEKGYQPIFPLQFNQQSVYDIVINNLPLNRGTLSEAITNMELVSSSGQNFKSATETNRFGQIPSLNSFFLGTGGAFALPFSINFKATNKKVLNQYRTESLVLEIDNVNEKVNSLRKMKQVQGTYVEINYKNDQINDQKQLIIQCKQNYPLSKLSSSQFNTCSKFAVTNNINVKETNSAKQTIFDAMFDINQQIFEQFLIKFDLKIPFKYSNGLLSISTKDEDQLRDLVNLVTNNNGIFIWSSNKSFLINLKPSLDEGEVGAQLMRKIVEVREGIDKRNIFYAHSRYENYFAKGLLRRMTQFFW